MSSNQYVAQFKEIFKDLSKGSNRYDVFKDFVTISSIALENVFLKCEEKESEYLRIVGQYDAEDVPLFSKLHATLVMALEVEPSDILGQLYMELEIGSAHLGQYFTPYPVCRMMAGLNIGADFDERLAKKGYVCVSEPASGSGSMLIAFAHCMLEKGYNPQRQMSFQAVDLDPVAARMAYIQLSLLGIVGEVVIGNSLTLKFSETMKTPAYYMWGYTLGRGAQGNGSEEVDQTTDSGSDDEPFTLNLSLFSDCKIAKSLSERLAL